MTARARWLARFWSHLFGLAYRDGASKLGIKVAGQVTT